MSILHQFVKHAADLPMWVNVPGLPFNIPVPGDRRERLPGMHEWVPTDVVERVGRKLDLGIPTDKVIHDEKFIRNPKGHAMNAFMGGSVGALAARLISGEKAVEPFKEILRAGTTRDALRHLRSLPMSMKVLPLLGAGTGAMVSKLNWNYKQDARERAAREAVRGILQDDLSNRKNMIDVAEAMHARGVK